MSGVSQKPIFVATHPRACSTAFERVFMTRNDALKCIHEPFGDAFYFGPERLSERYETDADARSRSGYATSTYKTVLDRFESEGAEGKRLFIKDMFQYLVPPDGQPATIAPSLTTRRKGVGTPSSVLGHGHGDQDVENGVHSGRPFPYHTKAEPGNPSVIPNEILKKFHFAFLIRHPSKSIPSYWRCTIPPLDKVTGFYNFMPSEAGYDELRRLFDYLRSIGEVGPSVAGQGIQAGANGGSRGASKSKVEICVVDADDLLDYPAEMIEKFCNSVGLDYHPEMLKWKTEACQKQAVDAFEKWNGFHDDAINSTELRARAQKHKVKSIDEEMGDWTAKYGAKAAETIRKTVEANLEDYNYLKQFAIKAGEKV